MIGYSLTQKGYILVNAENNAIFISRDVKFVENIFPFKHNKPETGYVLSMLWTLFLMIICKWLNHPFQCWWFDKHTTKDDEVTLNISGNPDSV